MVDDIDLIMGIGMAFTLVLGGSIIISSKPSGGTLPPPQCPAGDVAQNPDGTCPQGYELDVPNPGCCKPSTQPSKPRVEVVPYMDGNFASDITTYGALGTVTGVGCMAYTLNNSTGSLIQNVSAFNPSSDTSLAHSYGMKMVVLITAGSQNNGTDAGVEYLYNNPSAAQALAQDLISLAKSNGYDEWQFDFELGNVDFTKVTSLLVYLAQQLRAAGIGISLTTFPYQYQQYGAANLTTLAMNIDHLEIQNYAAGAQGGTVSQAVIAWEAAASKLVGSIPISKVDIGMGDYCEQSTCVPGSPADNCYPGPYPCWSSAQFAGDCLQYILANHVTRVSFWTAGGGSDPLLINDPIYADSIYGTSNFEGWLRIYNPVYTYTILAGDTFYALAVKYGTTVAAIEACNPGVDPSMLEVGQIIWFPVSV